MKKVKEIYWNDYTDKPCYILEDGTRIRYGKEVCPHQHHCYECSKEKEKWCHCGRTPLIMGTYRRISIGARPDSGPEYCVACNRVVRM